jgi:dTDP-3,4-didehydro-2,6-dideoxy-alpha-D-glucose 3-reductase
MTNKNINIVIWGLGNHSINRIIPVILNHNQFNLFGVCSRNENAVMTVSKEFACQGWTNSKSMLSMKKIDTVFISTPIGVHFEMSVMALSAKKNVFCEKPLTSNLNDTKRLIELAKNNNKMLVEAFMFLHHSQFKKIKNLVQNNEIGKVHSVSCRFGIPNLEKPGFRNNPDLGGGAFWDVGSYTVAAVLELFNYQNAKVLYAEVSKRENSLVDTEGRAILKFSKGTVAYLEWGIGVSYKNEIDLWGDNGSFYTDKIFSKPENYLPVYRIRNQYGNESSIDGEIEDQFNAMFRAFSDLSQSPDNIEKEYERIYNRASIMDKILNLAK